MKAIVDALLETSLYAAVVAGAILLFRALFHKSISPRLQYLAWLLLILRLLLPVTIESGFHVGSLFPQPAIEAVSAQAPAPGAVPAVQPSQADAPTQAAHAPISPIPRAETPAPATKKADWYAVAFGVWLSGMGLFALWMGFVKLRFYRRMRAHRLETPAEAAALYAACQKELGIKRPMPLWVVDATISPGIVHFAGPVLLLPAALLQSKEEPRFALLHELTHQKRGDHLLCALMNLLRTAYWFHPVVHYAFSEMQADMETACDVDVLRHLGAGEKRGYLATVVSLFSFEAQPQLGMARSRTRRMAERRMKGAFMKRTTSLASKFAAASLAVVLLLACFTTACQKAAGGTATLERRNEATPTPQQSAALPDETPIIPAQTADAESAGGAASGAPDASEATPMPTPASLPSGVLPTPTPASIPAGVLPTPVPTAIEPASEVKMIQERLVALGYAAQVTGDYDEATSAAVCAFQTRNGLQADGYAGLKTQERLYAADAVGAGASTYAAANIPQMLEYAKGALGKRYVVGGRGPDSFDSSGLVYYCLQMAGSDRQRLTSAKYAAVDDWQKITDMDSLQAGDLVFFYGNEGDQVQHVGIVLDGDTMIDASSANGKVVERSYRTSYWEKHFAWARRPW